MPIASGSFLFELFSVIGGQAGALGNLAGAALGGGLAGQNDPNAAFNNLIYDATQAAKNPGTIPKTDVPTQSTLDDLFGVKAGTGPNGTKSVWDNMPTEAQQSMLKGTTLQQLQRDLPTLFTTAPTPTTQTQQYSGYTTQDATFVANTDKTNEMYNFYSDQLKSLGLTNPVTSGGISFSYSPTDTSPTNVRLAKEAQMKLNSVYSVYNNYLKTQEGYQGYKSPEDLYNELNPAPPTADELAAQQTQNDLAAALAEQKAAQALEQKNLDTIMMNQLTRTRKKDITKSGNTILGPLTQ